MTRSRVAGTIEAWSLEEHQEVLKSLWNLHFKPLEAGSMQSRTTFLSTAGVLIYREHWSLPVHLHGELRRGQMAFALPSERGIPFRLQGRSIGASGIPWMNATAELDLVSSPGFENVVMIFEEQFLRQVASRVEHSFAEEPIPTHPVVSLTESGRAPALRRVVERLLSAVEDGSPDRVARRSMSSRLDERLGAALLAALPDRARPDSGDQSRLSPSRRHRLVSTCIEYARSKGLNVAIPDLCAATGVSRRTLEYAFREVTNTSPARYLRVWRLREVYMQLARAYPSQTTVTEVATTWGFFDLGTFSGTYQRFFGELPSQTLRRRAGRAEGIPERGVGAESLPLLGRP